jgi:asparagine synthase (glutamine-hydrolysing)
MQIDGEVRFNELQCSFLQPGYHSIVSDSLLFDRAELIEKLSLPGISPESVSDEQLILASYEKWGTDCPRYLYGEFSFAIWDSRNSSLFCVRDPMASRPFFYCSLPGRFIFAGDVEVILKSPGVPRAPNFTKIAALSLPDGHGALREQTFHAGICAILPGCSLEITRTGARMRRYWNLEVNHSLIPRQPDEVWHRLRTLLTAAVKNRIGQRLSVGSLLSGGLDSSSIVAIAARLLASKGGTVKAFAAVLDPDDNRGLIDERSFIEEFRSYGALDINYVTPPPNAGPFDDIFDPECFRRTFFMTSHRFVVKDLQRRAADLGVDLILDGGGGESGPTAHARDYLLQLAASGRWLSLGRELKQLKSRESRPVLRELIASVVVSLLPQWRKPLFLFLNPSFIRNYGPRIHSERTWPHHTHRQLMLTRQYLAARAADIWQWPIPHSYPLVDRRVIEFCLAAPGNMKLQDGYTRLLIRRALDGILPPRIQWRVGKSPFCPDYGMRYAAQLGIAQEWLAQIRPGDPIHEVVDISALRERLVPERAGQKGFERGVRIPTTMYLVNFLRQFSQFRV